MKKNVYLLLIVLLAIINISGCIDFTNSKTIYVGEDADYITIQNAIDNASDGDTVFVNKGIYYEFLYIKKSINLVGENKENTIIKYQDFGKFYSTNMIFVDKNDCTIKGFKIIGKGLNSDCIGIHVNSSKVNISSNIIIENYIGINFSENTFNNKAFKNTISENLYGIALRQSDNNNVSNNNISSSTFYGIYIYLAEGNYIFENFLSDNWYGIKVKGSERNLIFNNLIYNNDIGIETCCGSGYNIIYSNIFENNSFHANDTLFNQWDNGIIGNYWDDYIGDDKDDDGIGDTPYEITDSNNFDRFPLMNKGKFI